MIEFPFDTLKVRLQASDTKDPWRYSINMIQRDGIRSFYHGLPLPLVGAMLESACVFSVTGHLKQYLYNTRDTTISQTSFVAGLSGFVVAKFLTPIELIKCRMQFPSTPYRHSWDCLVQSVKQDGISVLCMYYILYH